MQPSSLFPATFWPNTSCLPQLAICCLYTVPNHFQKAYINLNQVSFIIILFMHTGFLILKKALLFGHHAQLKNIFNLHILEAFVNICLKILFFHELYKPNSQKSFYWLTQHNTPFHIWGHSSRSEISVKYSFLHGGLFLYGILLPSRKAWLAPWRFRDKCSHLFYKSRGSLL